MNEPSTFPFTAVIGQPRLKLALLLALLDPRLGGVLVSGPRGSAKSTLARAMTPFLSDPEGTFVTLPLGASEDRLIGSIDVEHALAGQGVRFQPGLLARAHQGILYMDEVNLLPDSLVDQLLDVAASGVNVIEREGVSHQHPARFLLVGTMNPDEGELRPQLTDRFGLSVSLDEQPSAAERVAIVRARRAFDTAPADFCVRYRDKEQALADQLATARAMLAQVTLDDALELHIAERCVSAGVEGVRADIAWQRACCAHAAWHGRSHVTREDVDATETLALDHRRTTPPPPSSPSSPPPEDPGNSGSNDTGGTSPPDTGGSGSDSPDATAPPEAQGQGGALPPQGQTTGQRRRWQARTAAQASPTGQDTRQGERSRAKGNARGQQRQGLRHQGAINWARTALSRHLDTLPTLHRHPRRQGTKTLTVILLDCSASLLGATRFGQTKGLLADLFDQAYKRRQHVAVLGFGQNRVHWAWPAGRPPRHPTTWLDGLEAGGGTPLSQALDTARQRIARWQAGMPHAIHSVLLTDGRVPELTAQRPWPCAMTLIDTEQGRVRLGRCRTLATELGARYTRLDAYMPMAATPLKESR